MLISNSIKDGIIICKNIFACLFSVHNTISLSLHEQVCLMRLHFKRYFSHHGRSISRNVASLNILVHDVINLLYYGIIGHDEFLEMLKEKKEYNGLKNEDKIKNV